jgi:acetyl esterase
MATSKTPHTKKVHHKESFFRRYMRVWKWLGWIFGVVFALALLVWIAFQVSPWPNSLLIRDAFDKNSAKVAQALQQYVPSNVTEVEDTQYRPNDKDARFDTFYPNDTDKQLPTIVWVHGGGWVSGGKDNIDNYMKILAGRGFTTISVNYSIAPEKQYPVPIQQLNDALGYVQDHAKQLHVDNTRIVMAGDSAGSQIVAQMANIMTSPSYATEIGIQPKMAADKLKGLLLNCGAYDLSLPDYNGPYGKFLKTVLWAYSGTKDFLNDPKLKTASVVNYVTPQFPPTFITAGNVDPLLGQSTEFAKKLQSLKVKTSTLFYASNHQPELNHEYQFDLDTADGQNALNLMVMFIRERTE